MSEMGVAPSRERETDGVSREPNPKSGEPVAQADAARTTVDNSAVAGAMSEMGVAPSREREADGVSREPNPISGEPVAQADAARPEAADNSAVAGAMSEMGVAPSREREADRTSREPQPTSDLHESAQPIAQAAESQSVSADDLTPEEQAEAEANKNRNRQAREAQVAQARREDLQLSAASAQREIAEWEARLAAASAAQDEAARMQCEKALAFQREKLESAQAAIAFDDAPYDIRGPRPASAEQPGPAPDFGETSASSVEPLSRAVAPPIPSPVADEADLPIIMPLDAASLMQPGAGRARKKKRGARRETSANDAVAEATATGAATPPMARKPKATQRNP
jgi:hypothetical protein